MIKLAIIWDVSPTLFSVGVIEIRWYSLCFLASFIIGNYIIFKIFKKENLDVKYLDKLFTYIFLGIIIGARLGHCLFYDPNYYLSNPIEIIKIWKGGLASHGGIIGICIAVLLYCRKYNFISFIQLLNILSIVLLLGASLIRIGNFFNSEIIGTVSNLPWAVQFVNAYDNQLSNSPRHPVQLYESFSYFMLFLIFCYLYFVKNKKDNLFLICLLAVFSIRFFLEFLKVQQSSIISNNSILSMGQILSIPIIICVIIILIKNNKKTR